MAIATIGLPLTFTFSGEPGGGRHSPTVFSVTMGSQPVLVVGGYKAVTSGGVTTDEVVTQILFSAASGGPWTLGPTTLGPNFVRVSPNFKTTKVNLQGVAGNLNGGYVANYNWQNPVTGAFGNVLDFVSSSGVVQTTYTPPAGTGNLSFISGYVQLANGNFLLTVDEGSFSASTDVFSSATFTNLAVHTILLDASGKAIGSEKVVSQATPTSTSGEFGVALIQTAGGSL